MKKSLIIAFLVLLAVIGWFLSGQISVGNESLNEQPNNQNSNINNDETIKKSNFLKVESQIIYAEEIKNSITLQGQTIHNRTIDVKSETTGNIISKNCSH